MKNLFYISFILFLTFSSLTVFSQKYKKPEDTIKLNKEYANLTAEIVDLNTKLARAENDLASYQSKADKASNDAADAASESSNQADKATNGTVKDAKSAKRKANRSYNEAKDSKSATKNLKEQENKISRFKSDISKKERRLRDLDQMRSTIYAKMQMAVLQHQ